MAFSSPAESVCGVQTGVRDSGFIAWDSGSSRSHHDSTTQVKQLQLLLPWVIRQSKDQLITQTSALPLWQTPGPSSMQKVYNYVN